MLRGRVGKQDRSICEFCRYRLLRRSARPLPRLTQSQPQSQRFFTSQCARQDSASYLHPFRPFSPENADAAAGANASVSTSTAPPTGEKGRRAKSKKAPRQVYSFVPQRRPHSDKLDPHEVKAREAVLTEQNQPKQPELPPDPDIKARFVWDAARQRAIEEYLRKEFNSTDQFGDVSRLPRLPRIKSPAISLSPHNLGSTVSVRFEPDDASRADRESAEPKASFYRRVAPNPRPNVVRRQPYGRPIDLAPSSSPSPSPRSAPDEPPPQPSLSSMLSSGNFFLAESSDPPEAETISPLRTGYANGITLEPRSGKVKRPRVGSLSGKLAAESKAETTKRKTAKHTKPSGSGGFEALEAAGARDAEIKNSAKKARKSPLSFLAGWGGSAPGEKTTHRQNSKFHSAAFEGKLETFEGIGVRSTNTQAAAPRIAWSATTSTKWDRLARRPTVTENTMHSQVARFHSKFGPRDAQMKPSAGQQGEGQPAPATHWNQHLPIRPLRPPNPQTNLSRTIPMRNPAMGRPPWGPNLGDNEIKPAGKQGEEPSTPATQWNQLARRPNRTSSLEDSFWNTMRSQVTKNQIMPASPPPAQPAPPRPASVPEPKPATVAKPKLAGPDEPVEPAPDRTSRFRAEAPKPARNERFELPDQEPQYEKRRGGKRQQRPRRASDFEDDDDRGDTFDRYLEKKRQKELRKAQRESERTGPIPIILPELISITAFAKALKIPPATFLSELGELGFEGVTLDSLMAGETAALVAQEYGYEPTVEAGEAQDLKPRPAPADPSTLPPRPPVVTIMGHVDHGKTTILDYLRKSSVAAQEHGGITQHIGAFSVKLSSGKQITFLDTPGHAAFLTMRQRGANVTDIVVLVVAADDSVKPQTLEALKHAQASKVPIIVAINKIDKEGARVATVKNDLAANGIEIEDFGGDVQVVCVSGKTGEGMDDLEENILTLSEILDHRSEVDGPAEGWVLESSLKITGKVATVLVKRGTLRPGDHIVAGITWAKVRQLRNEAGVELDEAPPGTPVEIVGWKDLPSAGDQVLQSPDEDRAKRAASYREGLREREKDAAEYEVISEARKALQEKRAREAEREAMISEGRIPVEEDLPEEENGTKMINFVVKCDVHGSVEAVCAVIQEVGNHEVQPRILRSATGAITEFDVEHAATSKSIIVNFATTTPGHVQQKANEQGVTILDHTVIYHLADAVKAKLSEHLAPELSIRVLGDAEVLQIFPVNIKGRVYKNIAGCRVRNGLVGKFDLYRVTRKGEIVFDGKLETLKHVKKDVTEMRKGTECGMGFENFQDLQVGDQIQAYEEVRTARTL
ncbi:hypothetical protein F4777DRAFT_570667 [Nemania sp. FL0916]|nr:hypothetical protein F4777DRAFT_570667 [Nemania sp. FL0916]